MKIRVLIIYVTSILSHSTRQNLRNEMLFEIKWMVTPCIYYPSRFSNSLSFLGHVEFFGLEISIGRSIQLINCSIMFQRKDQLSLYQISNDKEMRLILISLLVLCVWV